MSQYTSHNNKNLLKKLEELIEHCMDSDSLEASIPLTYAEANYIKRLILVDNYSTKISLENLNKARDLKKQKENQSK